MHASYGALLMGHLSRRLLVLTAIAGLIGTTVVVAGESEKTYLPSQTQAKTQVKAPEKAQAPSAEKPAKHKHKATKAKKKRHAHKRHRHHHRYAGGDFEDAFLFLPRLVFGIFR
jgi:multidrug efflux pump subunit AcrB